MRTGASDLKRFLNRYNFAFLASLLLLGVLYTEGRRNEHALRAANTAAMQTMSVMSNSQRMLSALQDVESGARGFLITGQPQFAETFESGRLRLVDARAQLKAAMPAEFWYRTWWQRIDPYIDARVRASMAVVEAVRQGAPELGTRLVKTNAGSVAMEEVRKHLLQLQAHEERRLAQRNAGINDQTARTRLLRLAMVIAAGVLLMSAVLAINFQAEKRRQALARARNGESQQRRQHAFLRTIIDTDENPIFVRDLAGRFVLVNKALGELVGCSVEELEGDAGPSADCLAMLQPLITHDADVTPDAPWRQDAVQMIDAAWQPRWFQIVKRALPGEGMGSVLTVAVDVSERMRAQRVKDEFVSTVSHELRTPLTSVRGALDLLGGFAQTLPGDALPLLDIARKNTERLLRLINDILDLQKIEAGQLTMVPAVHGLRGLLAHSVAAHEGYAQPMNVELVLHEGPDVQLRVDADRFAQVMANLLSNAIKHSPAGDIVEIQSEQLQGAVEISVRDHGRGIPKAFRPHVFERFTQAESNDARRKGGTGLGLAIAKSMIEQMGGTIGFDTIEGTGTTFHILLPLAEVDA